MLSSHASFSIAIFSMTCVCVNCNSLLNKRLQIIAAFDMLTYMLIFCHSYRAMMIATRQRADDISFSQLPFSFARPIRTQRGHHKKSKTRHFIRQNASLPHQYRSRTMSSRRVNCTGQMPHFSKAMLECRYRIVRACAK